MNELLAAKNVQKCYRKGGETITVLSGLDLTIAPGELLAIMGVSGVGKSTLLHLLGGLDRPDAGQIIFEGRDIASLSEAERCSFRNSAVGFVFQFHHLLADFNAWENVAIPGIIAGRSRIEMAKRAHLLLDAVGLSHRTTHRPREMSGGEQQRVAIARALALAPKVVLADEPTGNLDPETGERIHHMLLDLNKAEGAALVYVTHNPQLISAGTRVVKLAHGKAEDVHA